MLFSLSIVKAGIAVLLANPFITRVAINSKRNLQVNREKVPWL